MTLGHFLSHTHIYAPIDSQKQHSSVEVLRWEEGKRWQPRVEQLKIRLSERGKEVEVGQKQIVSLKEMLARLATVGTQGFS